MQLLLIESSSSLTGPPSPSLATASLPGPLAHDLNLIPETSFPSMLLHPHMCQQPGSAAPLCCLGSLLHLQIKDSFGRRDVIIRAQTCTTPSIKT